MRARHTPARPAPKPVFAVLAVYALAAIVALSLLAPPPGRSGHPAIAARAADARISGVAIQPSTRMKRLGLAIDVAGRLDAVTLTVTARLFDENGREEKQFTGETLCRAAESQTIPIAFPWPDPRLWDLDKPHLYTLQLAVKGPGIDDEIKDTFGFREFYIQGRQLFLNGIPIRLRPGVGANFEGDRNAGLNVTVVEENPFAGLTRNYGPVSLELINAADKSGWMTIVRLQSGIPDEIRRLRNHPSIIMWDAMSQSPTLPQDQNPRAIGRIDRTARTAPLPAFQVALDRCESIRRLDPTRPVFAEGAADAGDLYSANVFLDLLPLQEREDWLTEWTASGDMALMASGMGTPFIYSFFRGRDAASAITSEPLLTEFSAVYMGHEAYRGESSEYRAASAALLPVSGNRWNFSRLLPTIEAAEDYRTVESLFIRNTWRSWRAAGINGGMAPVTGGSIREYSPTEIQRALRESDGPTLAWIVGPWDAPTAKTHSYHCDETVEKRICLINDTRETQPFRYSWRAMINGKLLTAESGKGEIKPAQTLFRPLRFATPFFSSGTAQGEIVLNVAIGKAAHEDRFRYRVFARRPRRDRPPSLPVINPGGKTGDVLPVVDCIPRAWHGERNVPIVIVGQNALKPGQGLPAGLEPYVRGGGRVLVMSQRPEWVRDTLGMRTAEAVARRVFPVSESHPMMRSIDALDMRDWRGLSTVVPGKPTYTGPTPEFGWRWGNRGAVASVSIEKPHMSSWTPILEDEFDLAYTPLMEMSYGRGRITWCSLDIEDHAITDAAAERVFARMMDYVLHAPLTPKADRIVYVGGQAGAKLLDGMGVVFRDAGLARADAALLASADAPQLLIVGPEVAVTPADLAGFLGRGGRALFLRREPDSPGGSPVIGMELRHGSLQIPAWPECRGLGVSDMHWRADVEWPVIRNVPELPNSGGIVKTTVGADGLLGRIAVGKGVALFCQIAPDRLDADNKTYLRYTRWRQTRALSQLLSNMGATFKQDSRIFRPNQEGPGFYHPDYRTDFALGDNPYRYYRW
ncbi:MAG TPA: hypothetical protein VKT77_09315 [Chthonomonadaceae bacterium]|nr:hypothetical protein [Chthonomonadaceae bacterium]